MSPQELIDVLKSASPSELAWIRSLLRVPDANYGSSSFRQGELPKNLGEVWNRTEQRVDNRKKSEYE